MQGKIFAIPYAAWIAAFVFDVLIIIDSYPAALLLFLLLSYHSYKKFFLKQAGTYKILICLGGDHSLLKIVKYRYLTESKAAGRKKEAASQIHTLL